MKKTVLIAVLGLLAAVLPVAAVSAQDTPTCAGFPATIVGTEGNDNIVGTTGRDVIVGLGGADVIRGLSGADIICGGPGRDRLLGGKQADLLIGGEDGDKLFGDAGRDMLVGEQGNDLLVGGQGDDLLDGGRGRRDRLRGRSGQDTCVDEQANASFDTTCLSGPNAGPAFTIDSCRETGEASQVPTAGRITNTSIDTVDYLITVDLIDGAGNVFAQAFGRVFDVMPGVTAQWEVTATDAVLGLDECVAVYEAVVPENEPGELWNVSVDDCGAGEFFGMTFTGQVTNTLDVPLDLAIHGQVIGLDGVRYAESSLDFLEDAQPGQTVDFLTLGGSEPVNGLQYCDVFVSAFEPV